MALTECPCLKSKNTERGKVGEGMGEMGWEGGAQKTEARKQDSAEQAIGKRTQTELGEGRRPALIFPFKRKKEEGRLQDDSRV